MLASPLIDAAHSIAEQAYRGQIDQIQEPYILHPEMVALFVERLRWFRDVDEPTQQAAVVTAWLLDVIEDTDETAESLRTAGVSERAIAAVVALTHTADVPVDDHYVTIAQQPLARLVKVAGIASNLGPERVARLEPGKRDKLAKHAHALGKLQVVRSAIDDLHVGI